MFPAVKCKRFFRKKLLALILIFDLLLSAATVAGDYYLTYRIPHRFLSAGQVTSRQDLSSGSALPAEQDNASGTTSDAASGTD